MTRFGAEVTFHKTRADFEAAWRASDPTTEPQNVAGFFDPTTGELHMNTWANEANAFHEVIHRVRQESFPETRRMIGDYLDEGITELITRERAGDIAASNNYDPNVQFADFLRMTLGQQPIENVVLHGDYATFQRAVRTRAGSEGRAFEVMRLLKDMPASGDPIVEARIRELLGGNDIPEPFVEGPTREIPIEDMQARADEAERIHAQDNRETAEIEAVVAEEFPSEPEEGPQRGPSGDTQESLPPPVSSVEEDVTPTHPVVEQAVQEVTDAMQDIGESAVRDIAAQLSDRALELTYATLVVRARTAATPQLRQAMIDAAGEVMAEYWTRPGLPSARVSRKKP
jgi:hypothetical protein